MVYFLKFCAGWILPPGIFIVLFVAVAYYAWFKRSEKKIAAFIFGLTFMLYLLCTSFVAEKFLGNLESVYEPPKTLPDGDVIIMLGGGAMPDAPDVDGKGALCSAPANRLLTVVRLERKLNVPLLLSGGQVYADSGEEAKIAKRTLMSLGVKESAIILETKSINTAQNARFSAELLREKNFSRPILVTSAFHMKRAVLNFERENIKVIPYPTDYMVSREPVFHYTKLRPQSEALLQNVTVLQETLRTFVTRYLYF